MRNYKDIYVRWEKTRVDAHDRQSSTVEDEKFDDMDADSLFEMDFNFISSSL